MRLDGSTEWVVKLDALIGDAKLVISQKLWRLQYTLQGSIMELNSSVRWQ